MQTEGLSFGEKYPAVGLLTPVMVSLKVVPTEVTPLHSVTQPERTHEVVQLHDPQLSHKDTLLPLVHSKRLYECRPTQPVAAGNLVKSCREMFWMSVLAIAIRLPR